MRDLALTSPLTRGGDVVLLQRALNALGALNAGHTVTVDGVFGPTTEHVVNLAAFNLGLSHYGATQAVIYYIFYPHRRLPQQLALAHQRHLRHLHYGQITGSARGPAAALAYAAHYIGISEHPAGSNWGEPYPAEWIKHSGFKYGVSWCGCFARVCAEAGGAHLTARCSFVPYIIGDAHAKTAGFLTWNSNHQQAAPGDLVCYCWDGSGVGEHVGIVKEIHSDHLVAIEGNTGGSNPSDGGMVALTARSYQFVLGYARPRY